MSRLARKVAIRELLYLTYLASIGVQRSRGNPHRLPLSYIDAIIILEVTCSNSLYRLESIVLDVPGHWHIKGLQANSFRERLTILANEVSPEIPHGSGTTHS